jgi:hypothetical protein
VAIDKLKQRLAQPQGFNSYGQIQQWLKAECGVVVAYRTVHQTVRYKLNAKLKVPRPRSKNAKPEVQQAFKKTQRPNKSAGVLSGNGTTSTLLVPRREPPRTQDHYGSANYPIWSEATRTRELAT